MRLKHLESTSPRSRAGGTTERPPKAATILQFEQKLDEGIEFDPRRDIRESDIQAMKEALFEFRRTKDRWLFSSVAMYMISTFPEQVDELGLDEGVWEWLKGGLNENREHADVSALFSALAMRLVALFPDRRDELVLDEEVWLDVTQALNMHRENGNWWGYASLAASLAALFPKRRHEIRLHEFWSQMKDSLEKERGKNWMVFSNFAAHLILLFPERRDELVLDEKAWEGMRKQMDGHRGKQWKLFSRMVRDLTILASQDAHITAEGRIEIVPKRPKLSGGARPLPNRKR